MIQLKEKPSEPVCVHLLDCKVITSNVWNEEINCDVITWGLQVTFNNGEIVCFPDLCTNKLNVEKLNQMLAGSDLRPEHIYDVVEDYIDLLNGLPLR